jgi:O-antigen/teichoic acid export membrane protein
VGPGEVGAATGRRITANIVFTGMGQAVGVVSQLVTVPLYLLAWGERLYGDWITVTALAAYLGLADLGMQLYVTNRLTQEALQERWDDFTRTFQSALAVYAVVAGVGALVLAALAAVLPWGAWFEGRTLAGGDALVLTLMAGTGVLVSVGNGFLTASYRAFVEPERASMLAAGQRALVLVATVALLAARAGPFVVAAAQLAVPVLFGVWVARDLSRRHPRVAFSFARADRATAVSLIFPSVLYLLILVANGLTIQGTVLVASALLGPAAVTTFATSRTLVSAVRQAVGSVNHVLAPELTRLDALGATERVALAHRLIVKLSCAAALWLVGSLYFVGPLLYALWTGGRAQFDLEMFRWLLLWALLQTPWLSSQWVLLATNRHRGVAVLYLVQGVLALGASAIAVPRFGLQGIAFALVATDFLTFGILVPWWAQRHVGEPPLRYFLEIYAPLAAATAVAMLAGWAVEAAVGSSHAALALVPLAVGAALLPALLLWLRAAERAAVFAFGRRALGGTP